MKFQFAASLKGTQLLLISERISNFYFRIGVDFFFILNFEINYGFVILMQRCLHTKYVRNNWRYWRWRLLLTNSHLENGFSTGVSVKKIRNYSTDWKWRYNKLVQVRKRITVCRDLFYCQDIWDIVIYQQLAKLFWSNECACMMRYWCSGWSFKKYCNRVVLQFLHLWFELPALVSQYLCQARS